MKLRIGKTYQTKIGLSAKIVRTYQRGEQTVFVAQVRRQDENIPVGYTERGELLELRHRDFALAI